MSGFEWGLFLVVLVVGIWWYWMWKISQGELH